MNFAQLFQYFTNSKVIKMILNVRGNTFLSLLGWHTQSEIMF